MADKLRALSSRVLQRLLLARQLHDCHPGSLAIERKATRSKPILVRGARATEKRKGKKEKEQERKKVKETGSRRTASLQHRPEKRGFCMFYFQRLPEGLGAESFVHFNVSVGSRLLKTKNRCLLLPVPSEKQDFPFRRSSARRCTSRLRRVKTGRRSGLHADDSERKVGLPFLRPKKTPLPREEPPAPSAVYVQAKRARNVGFFAFSVHYGGMAIRGGSGYRQGETLPIYAVSLRKRRERFLIPNTANDQEGAERCLLKIFRLQCLDSQGGFRQGVGHW